MSFQSTGGSSSSASQAGSVAIGQQGTGQAEAVSTAMSDLIIKTDKMEMKQLMEMGLIQMMTKLSEALSKLFKAMGDAVKGLLG